MITYMLMDNGELVQIDAELCKSVFSITFTRKGGKVVEAIRFDAKG